MEFDTTKMVEEIVIQARENQEEFIFETIRPYCENVLQMKINKEELKQILLSGARPKGKWIEVFVETPNDPYRYGFKAHKCSKCEYRPFQISDYCPNCGAEMSEDCNKQNL